MFSFDWLKMARADNAFASRQIAGKIGNGIEFARKKFEHRLIKHMDKAAVWLHVADCKWLEALGSSVGMVVALEVGIDRKITWGLLAIFCASFGRAKRYCDEMEPTALGWGKSDRESLFASGVEKKLVGVVT